MGVVYGPALRSARADVVSAAEGFITQEPCNLAGAFGTSIPTTGAADGAVMFTLIGLRAGEVVTNLITYMTVNGSVQTLVKLALFSTAGVRLAVSADEKARFASGAAKLCVCPMVTPYVVPADDAFYAALISVGGVGPTLARANASFDAIALPGKFRRYGRQGTQTDMPSPGTISTGSGPAFWFAVS